MSPTDDPLNDVRQRFSHADAAPRWQRMYDSETRLLEEDNFRRRRDVAVSQVLRLATPGTRVLDLGCGSGPVLAELRRRGIDVLGIDASDDMLAQARARLRRLGLPDDGVFQGDCRHTPWPDESADIVLCLGVISYVPDYGPILDEIVRLLKPGGTLLLSFRNRFNPLLSDPVKLARRSVRHLLRPLLGPPPREPWQLGHFLDFREVNAAVTARGLHYVDFTGIGFGPLRVAGQPVFSEAVSIALSHRLGALAEGFGIHRPLRWLTDVSLWRYQKPGAL